jgi:hypothetical protein
MRAIKQPRVPPLPQKKKKTKILIKGPRRAAAEKTAMMKNLNLLPLLLVK